MRDKYMFANIKLRVTDEKKEREEKDYPNISDPHLLLSRKFSFSNSLSAAKGGLA